MTTSYHAQRRISIDDAGAVAVSSDVNAIVGSTATLLTRPAGDIKMLVLMADKGAWRVRVGDFHTSGMPAAADPTVTISDNSGGVKIAEGKSLIIPAPDLITVKGYAGTDALTYYWL